MSFQITHETLEVNNLVQRIRNFANNFQEHEEIFIHCKSEEKYYLNLSKYVPDYKYRLELIYGNGRDVAISARSHLLECTDITQTSTLVNLIEKLEINLSYLKDLSERTYTEVEKICNEIKYDDYSINLMIQTNKNMCTEINTIFNLLNLLKQSNTFQLEAGLLTMTDLNTKPLNGIINNYSGTFQQSQFQSGANSTMNINQINNQALQQVCKQIREVINNSQEPASIKQTLNTDINNFENAQSSAERKIAFEALLSNSSSIATLWSALAPYIPELTKYLG